MPIYTPAGSYFTNYGTFNVRDYGAQGDWNGTSGSDDTTAIQAAVTAALAYSQGGSPGVVLFPPGRYKITSGLTVGSGTRANGITLAGVGAHDATTSTSGAWWGTAAQIVTAFDGDALRANAVPAYLQDLSIVASAPGTRRTGAAFRASTVYGLNVHNCTFQGHAYGIQIDGTGASSTYIDRVYVQGCTTGISVAPSGASWADLNSLHINDVTITGNAQGGTFTTGLELESVTTGFICNLEIVGGATGVSVGQTKKAELLAFTNVQSDTCTSYCWNLGQYASSITLTDCQGNTSGTGPTGFYLNACNDVTLTGCRTYYGTGYRVAGAAGITMTGNTHSSYSTGNPAPARAVTNGFVFSGTNSRIVLQGNRVYSSAAGVDYGAGAFAGLIVSGNLADTAASNTATRDAATSATVVGNYNW